LTPYVDWNDFSHVSNTQLPDPTADQHLFPLSFGPYPAVPNSAVPGFAQPEPSIPQHHVTYDTSVNDFAIILDPTGQSADYFGLDHELLSLQPSFDFSNNFDMSDPTLDISTALPDLGRKTTELKCTFPNCSDDVFSTYSAFQKHLNRHTKPYHCSVPDCKTPQFGDKGGLDRHRREVHGPNRHYCPIVTCKRHRTGFPRKYNLFEHQKRCHPQSPTISLSTRRPPREQSPSQFESMEDVRKSDEEVTSPELEVTGDLSTGGGKVQEKLRALLALRAEIDRDIETLRMTVDILDES